MSLYQTKHCHIPQGHILNTVKHQFYAPAFCIFCDFMKTFCTVLAKCPYNNVLGFYSFVDFIPFYMVPPKNVKLVFYSIHCQWNISLVVLYINDNWAMPSVFCFNFPQFQSTFLDSLSTTNTARIKSLDFLSDMSGCSIRGKYNKNSL